MTEQNNGFHCDVCGDIINGKIINLPDGEFIGVGDTITGMREQTPNHPTRDISNVCMECWKEQEGGL